MNAKQMGHKDDLVLAIFDALFWGAWSALVDESGGTRERADKWRKRRL